MTDQDLPSHSPSDRMLEISEEVIEKVGAALNRAIALATRFEPALTKGFIEAAGEL